MTVSPPRDGEPPVEEPQSVQPKNRPPCPRCGTPHEPNQEYCLECGLRLPVEANGLVPRLGRAWRRQLGWYPGDWVWPSLLALLIAALAGIGAAAFVSQDQKRADYVTAADRDSEHAIRVAPDSGFVAAGGDDGGVWVTDGSDTATSARRMQSISLPSRNISGRT